MEFADLLRDAIDAKARADGRRYSYRLLGWMAGCHWSQVQKLAAGTRTPSAMMIQRLCHVLDPHLPEDLALIAAGRAPRGPRDALAEMIEIDHRRASFTLGDDADATVREAQAELDALMVRARELIAVIARAGRPTTATPTAPAAASSTAQTPTSALVPIARMRPQSRRPRSR